MRELLERWAEMEPERCGISEHAAHLGKSFAFRIHWAVLTADPINLAVILATVIEAIEARGWWWKLQRYGTNPRVRAYVGPADPLYAPIPRDADTSAVALLGAYLAALEAEEGAQ